MNPDGSPRSALGFEPAASLTSVRVKRRQSGPAPGGKRGDLTAGEMEIEAAPMPVPEAEGPVALLLAPPAPEPPLESHAEPSLSELLLALATPEPEPEPELECEATAAPELDPELEREPEFHATAAPEPEPEPQPAAIAAPEPEIGDLDIIDYWDSLRGAREVPELDDLDCGHVAATWPNTLLLAVEQTDLPRVTRLGENNGEIEYTAMVLDWIMARARHSARRAEPMEEEQRFAVSSGGARYRLLLLPIASSGRTADHVLCQLARIQERSAVASFRRWLAG